MPSANYLVLCAPWVAPLVVQHGNIWRTLLIFLPLAQESLSFEPGLGPNDLSQVVQTESRNSNHMSLDVLSGGPPGSLDLFPWRRDENAPHPASSVTKPRSMRSFDVPPSTQSDDRAWGLYPVNHMQDGLQFHHVPAAWSPSVAHVKEIDFMGISNKRTASNYLMGEPAGTRSQNERDNQLAYQGQSGEYVTISGLGELKAQRDAQPDQLDLGLTLHHPENVSKKQRVASAAIVIATDNLNREILPREGQGSIPMPWEDEIRPQLDLGLDLGHPQIPREKQQVPHIPPASPRAEAHNMNEWTSAEKGTGIAISDSSSRAPPGSPLLLPSPGDGEGSGVTTKVPLTQDEEIAEAHEASIALLELRDHVVSLPENEENNKVIRILKRKRNKQPGPQKTQDHGTVNVIKDSKSKGKASVFEDPLRKTKTTAEMIYLFHSSHTEKVWAWIYGGTTCVIDKDDLRLKRLSDSRYVSELASIMDQNIRQKGHHPPGGMISASEVHDNVSHFVEQMLLTNLRLLRGLGTVSEKIYVDELESLHRWLVNILTEEHNQPPAHIDQSKVEIFPGLNLKQLVDSVSLVLSSKSPDKLVHTLVKKEKVIHSFISVISEQQLLMVKTVVTLSASYYRLQNPEKWGFLYQDEGVFLSYLAKLQSPYIRSDIQVLAQPKTFMDVLKLLPWTNEWEYHPGSKSRSLAMSMSLSSRTNWDDWVEPFEMGVPAVIGYDVWATISLIGRGEEGIILEDSASFNPVLNRFQPKETTKMLSQTFLKMCNDRQITFPEVKYFVSLVWILHSRLIEAFGYQAKDHVYLEEQNQLQTEMFEILNQPRDHGKVSEGLAEGPTIDIADERKVLSDMIFLH
ncbi:hypothetical protein H4Q26_009311 [Puccinia striiformis f. sp. tritici PST-130]|nr:hypothetical protein H4Q26_009311 [Puccinia striiformis f. sp. tritici PST-130]